MLPPFARQDVYGSMGAKDPLGSAAKRRPTSLTTVFVNMALPWAAFGLVFWALSFHLRFDQPGLACLLAAFFFGAGVTSGVMAWQMGERRLRSSYWYHYFAVTMLLSVVAAGVLGSLNYEYNMRKSYTLASELKFYKEVNVGETKGQQLMDAGLVTFSKDTGLDTSKSMGFRDGDTYCVAPITNGDANLLVYDFWAIGINCCSSIKPDFRCGKYDDPKAHGGLRLVGAEERPHYKLAVEAAEAAYGIRSAHPLFFEWVKDPVDELAKLRMNGYQLFIFCLMVHFCFSLVGVVVSNAVG